MRGAARAEGRARPRPAGPPRTIGRRRPPQRLAPAGCLRCAVGGLRQRAEPRAPPACWEQEQQAVLQVLGAASSWQRQQEWEPEWRWAGAIAGQHGGCVLFHASTQAPESGSGNAGGGSGSGSGRSSDSSGMAAASSNTGDGGAPAVPGLPPLPSLLGQEPRPAAQGPGGQLPREPPPPAAVAAAAAGPSSDGAAPEGRDSAGVRAALAALRWYKATLSPLMASTCRFLPTCSQYSMDAYRQYGVARGTVLTAWRLLRCNPWGGTGYDPAAWPPVGLPAWMWGAPCSAEVAVVVGAAAFVRAVHALLFE